LDPNTHIPVTSSSQQEVLVVGGGVAGCAAAIALARKDRGVTLIEREPAPRHKVCGEFLSGEALEDLHALGIDVASLGAAPIDRVRLAAARRAAEAPLPFLPPRSHAKLWTPCSSRRPSPRVSAWNAAAA
jgi:2-polyprenyl-6-methoxyphenol hydroxylase-like FAD-dependent oxidoreductase